MEEEEEEYEEEKTRFHQLFSSEFNSALFLHPFPISRFLVVISYTNTLK